MRKTFVVTSQHGLVGMNKQTGDTFEAEETDQDIQVLKQLGDIKEQGAQQVPQTLMSQPETKVVEAAGSAIAGHHAGAEAETVVEGEQQPRRRSTYERSDMTAAKPRGPRK